MEAKLEIIGNHMLRTAKFGTLTLGPGSEVKNAFLLLSGKICFRYTFFTPS